VFLFQAGTTLTTAASTYFNLINGAKAKNVLFALGSAATLGANSVLEGSLIVGTSVTVGIEAEVNGCIIAKAAVTYEGRGGTTLP
jgi:ADP-glucose pyrophosphorylase